MSAVTAAVVSGVAGIAGAAIAGHGASSAAKTQADAANQAAQVQAKSAQDALDFQKQQYNTNQQQIAPWLQAGTAAIGQLGKETLNGGVPAFQQPTNVTEQNDPGFQFRLQQGQQALERSAAARGGLLSGGTAKALDAYSQGEASNEYGNVYNRALTNYNTNTIAQYNRLAGLAGVGQQAQASGAAQGQAGANNISNLLMTSGEQQAQGINNSAAARASGYAGGANAWSGVPAGIGNSLAGLMNPQSQSNYGMTSTQMSSLPNQGNMAQYDNPYGLSAELSGGQY